ncbi:S41 family peptidase [Williamwhitmania taraxaci]|uniref:Peptidase family S41 n=1 Tax=Williamwhitmania taraxaci TaxID=1640674 RepID=A0A1G6PZ98_9BACT|nr:S41 family peptidase [Williamwhitmania taraxaci]SDC85398.1 Peptidase family S41 [Williamwhitmania taraxaci]
MKKIFLSALGIICLVTVQGQTIKAKRQQEVDYLLKSYAESVPDTLRGLTPDEWNNRVNALRSAVNSSKTGDDYYMSLRYFGALIYDYHSEFPDGGLFNRNLIFLKTDTVLPIWVKNWSDGRTFLVKDYTGKIPAKAELLTINGYSAQALSLRLRDLNPGEDRYAFPIMNEREQPDIRGWATLSNLLFMEKMRPPYSITYREYDDTSTKAATLRGMMRDSIFHAYKKSGDKRRVRQSINYSKCPIVYHRTSNETGVLTINMFYGKSILQMMLWGGDNRYSKLLRRSMKQIERDGIKTLVIDIRGNPGGFMGSVLRTMNYLSDSSITEYEVFKVSEKSKVTAIPLLKNTYRLYYGRKQKAQRDSSVAIFKRMPNGSLFPLDTLLPLVHKPLNLKHKFHGKVYVLTDALCYSASIVFCNMVRETGCGIIAGEAPGGFIQVTGGPRLSFSGSSHRFIRMNPTYSLTLIPTEPNYSYLKMDIPLEQTLDQWLNGKDDKLERLLSIIELSK